MTTFAVPGGWELWIIAVVALLLFGHRIPGIARSVGSGFHELKRGLRSGEEKERDGD